jgi:hypothetical protein
MRPESQSTEDTSRERYNINHRLGFRIGRIRRK